MKLFDKHLFLFSNNQAALEAKFSDKKDEYDFHARDILQSLYERLNNTTVDDTIDLTMDSQEEIDLTGDSDEDTGGAHVTEAADDDLGLSLSDDEEDNNDDLKEVNLKREPLKNKK